jgi:alpha-glucosidase (family GH31 glycosyl hydrolase)
MKFFEIQNKYFGRSFFPPYWALGFQVSRYGYQDINEMRQIVDRFRKEEIPLASL